MKKRLLRSLLKQVVLTSKGLSIFMPLADGMEIPNHQIQLVNVLNEKSSIIAIARKASSEDSNLLVLGSDIGKMVAGMETA